MLDGDDCRHTISDVCSGKVHIFVFQDPQFSGIGVDHSGKDRLKSRNVGATLCIVNIVAESKNIFMELIHILKCCFHSDAVTLPLEIDHIMKCFLRFIQILYKSYQPVRLVVDDMFHFRTSPVLENNRQFRV